MTIKQMNEMIAKLPEIKEVEQKVYDFSKVSRVYDLTDGVYSAYIIDLVITDKMVTVQMYIKAQDEPQAEGHTIIYKIGDLDTAYRQYTKLTVTDIQEQLKFDETHKQRVKDFWSMTYPSYYNNCIADGMLHNDAVKATMKLRPIWCPTAHYKNLGTVTTEVYHAGGYLKFNFNKYNIDKY